MLGLEVSGFWLRGLELLGLGPAHLNPTPKFRAAGFGFGFGFRVLGNNKLGMSLQMGGVREIFAYLQAISGLRRVLGIRSNRNPVSDTLISGFG